MCWLKFLSFPGAQNRDMGHAIIFGWSDLGTRYLEARIATSRSWFRLGKMGSSFSYAILV
jgi:hypothetical protein